MILENCLEGIRNWRKKGIKRRRRREKPHGVEDDVRIFRS